MVLDKLLLVDGTAALYRAFFAIPGLRSKSGEPTNAVYGFIRIMKQMLCAWRPTHAAVVLDGGIPQERLALLETYKAQRKPMPSDLKSQIPLAMEYLKLSGMPCLRLEGQEADDVMATIARKAEPVFARVLLATSDKDMFQLVNERINLVSIGGADRDGKTMGPDEIAAKTGVRPSQIVDWLSLVGDASDNIPGVNGIGPKTAASLLNKFGSVDAIFEKLNEIPSQRLRAALEASRDLVKRNTEMVRLRTDLACSVEWHDLLPAAPSRDDLRRFFERLDFHSLLEEQAFSWDLFEQKQLKIDI